MYSLPVRNISFLLRRFVARRDNNTWMMALVARNGLRSCGSWIGCVPTTPVELNPAMTSIDFFLGLHIGQQPTWRLKAVEVLRNASPIVYDIERSFAN